MDREQPSAWLEEVAALITPRLPLGGPEIAALVPAAPRGEDAVSLASLARAFARGGVPAPFRLVRREGFEIAVSPATAPLAAPLYENAARQVTAWGIAEVDAVVERVVALSPSSASTSASTSATIAKRLLVALPRLRWLDERRTWFSLTGERSPLGVALGKIFSVARVVELDVLAGALAKHHHIVRRVPRAVLARYLTDVAGCLLSDGDVHPSSSLRRVALSAEETELVERLLASGGQAARAEIHRPPASDPSTRLAWKRLVRRSPLLVEAEEHYSLVGTARVARARPAASRLSEAQHP